MKTEDILKYIENAISNGKSISDLCFELDYNLTFTENIDHKLFEYIINIMQSKNFTNYKNANNLIMVIFNNFNKFNSDQISIFTGIFEKSIIEAKDKNYSYSVADLIARKFPRKNALNIFKKWQHSKEPMLENAGISGTYIISNINNRELM